MALETRTRMLGMNACSFTADVTADYGNRTYDFTVAVSYQKDGESILRVTRPENLSGISVTYSKEGTSLSFDGARIETGSLSSAGLSPLSALPMLLAAAQSGLMAECGFETLDGMDTLAITCREELEGEETEQKLWFDLATGAILRGEILAGGDTVIACVFTEFLFGD
jgi:outer membrane lipoprotein-sorting protein